MSLDFKVEVPNRLIKKPDGMVVFKRNQELAIVYEIAFVGETFESLSAELEEWLVGTTATLAIGLLIEFIPDPNGNIYMRKLTGMKVRFDMI